MDLGRTRLHELPAPDVWQAIRDNWTEFYIRLGQAPGVEFFEGPHLSWTLTGIPDPFLNVIFRTSLPPDEPGHVVDEALAHFRVKGIPTLSWLTPGPDAGPHLLSRGLTFSEGGRAMAADLAALPDSWPTSPGVEIIAVEDRARLRSWVHVMRIGFGTPESAERDLLEVFAAIGSGPQMCSYLVLLDGQPVATSQVLLGAGVAGIYQVTCLPRGAWKRHRHRSDIRGVAGGPPARVRERDPASLGPRPSGLSTPGIPRLRSPHRISVRQRGGSGHQSMT
jgi:hypothetical protein